MDGTGRRVAGALNWLLLALGVVVAVVGAFMSVFAAAFAFIPSVREEILRQAGEGASRAEPVLTVSWGLIPMALIVVMSAVLLFTLRRVVLTVERRNPFDPANPGRLRTIALLLAAIELVRWGTLLILAPEQVDLNEDIDRWFGSALSVLVVIVLAEAFREGARLRAEAELTV